MPAREGCFRLGFVNLPIGIVTALLARRRLPADQGIGLQHGADVPGAALLVSALYLQQVLHYDPIQVGLAFLPVALGIAVMSLGFSTASALTGGYHLAFGIGAVLVGVGIVLAGVVLKSESATSAETAETETELEEELALQPEIQTEVTGGRVSVSEPRWSR